MMTRHEIETATREQLADELAASCQANEGWQTMPIEPLRADVLASVSDYYPCCHCDGTGVIVSGEYGTVECSACDGSGEANDDVEA